jgi:hypothetical protein
MGSRSAAAVVGYILGVLGAGGASVVIITGHPPWYTWLTLVNSIGTIYVIWSVRKAERAGQTQPPP